MGMNVTDVQTVLRDQSRRPEERLSAGIEFFAGQLGRRERQQSTRPTPGRTQGLPTPGWTDGLPTPEFLWLSEDWVNGGFVKAFDSDTQAVLEMEYQDNKNYAFLQTWQVRFPNGQLHELGPVTFHFPGREKIGFNRWVEDDWDTDIWTFDPLQAVGYQTKMPWEDNTDKGPDEIPAPGIRPIGRWSRSDGKVHGFREAPIQIPHSVIAQLAANQNPGFQIESRAPWIANTDDFIEPSDFFRFGADRWRAEFQKAMNRKYYDRKRKAERKRRQAEP